MKNSILYIRFCLMTILSTFLLLECTPSMALAPSGLDKKKIAAMTRLADETQEQRTRNRNTEALMTRIYDPALPYLERRDLLYVLEKNQDLELLQIIATDADLPEDFRGLAVELIIHRLHGLGDPALHDKTWNLLKRIVASDGAAQDARAKIIRLLGARCLEFFQEDLLLSPSFLRLAFDSYCNAERLDIESLAPLFLKRFKLFVTRYVPEAMLETPEKRLQVLNCLLKINKTRVVMKVNAIAAMRAAKSLVFALHWDEQVVVIHYIKEMNRSMLEKEFPGFKIEPYGTQANLDEIRISFEDVDLMEIRKKNHFVAPLVPFKYLFPRDVSETDLHQCGRELNIGERPVIVFGSPREIELATFMKCYETLYRDIPIQRRPVVIIAPRHRMDLDKPPMRELFSHQALVTRESTVTSHGKRNPMPDLKNNNVLIVNTRGELSVLYGLAHVTLIGSDRNIFEPAVMGKPILYFGKPDLWPNNRDALDALTQENGAAEFNPHLFESLMGDPQLRIEMGTAAKNAYEYTKDQQTPDAANKAVDQLLPVILIRTIFGEGVATNSMNIKGSLEQLLLDQAA